MLDLERPSEATPGDGGLRPARPTAMVDTARALAATIVRHRTLASLRASADWPAFEPLAAATLGTVRRYAARGGPLADADRVCVVQWNVEHGNAYAQVECALREQPALSHADVILLDEIDLGMARAGNRDVTGDLAEALGMHAAWAPLFLETTVGRDDDARTAGDRANEESLFGIAVLSRWPLGRVRVVPLPGPYAFQFAQERMFGRFGALVADVEHPRTPFVSVAVHLEVHRTRRHREEQVRVLLAALASERRPIVLAGDWNTHTFDRGTPAAPLASTWALLASPGRALRERLMRPDRGPHREPLFDRLREAGFAWDEESAREPSLSVRVERLDEWRALPSPLRALTRRTLARMLDRSRLRLDWIAWRGFARADGPTVVVPGLDVPGGASDHAPVAATLVLP